MDSCGAPVREAEIGGGVERRKGVRQHAWFRRKADSSRVSEWAARRRVGACCWSGSDCWSNRKQSGKGRARCRLARKPKLRMRTKPRGQQVQEEAAQELIDRQGHEPLLVAVSGVAPAEGDVALGESNQPVVGDGDAVGVGAEIAQHMFWSAEGPFGVDDPVVAEQDSQPGGEGARFGEAARDVRGTGVRLRGRRS